MTFISRRPQYVHQFGRWRVKKNEAGAGPSARRPEQKLDISEALGSITAAVKQNKRGPPSLLSLEDIPPCQPCQHARRGPSRKKLRAIEAPPPPLPGPQAPLVSRNPFADGAGAIFLDLHPHDQPHVDAATGGELVQVQQESDAPVEMLAAMDLDEAAGGSPPLAHDSGLEGGSLDDSASFSSSCPDETFSLSLLLGPPRPTDTSSLFSGEWDSVKDLIDSVRNFDSNRHVDTISDDELQNLKDAAEYLGVMHYKNEAFTLCAYIIKKIQHDANMNGRSHRPCYEVFTYARYARSRAHHDILRTLLENELEKVDKSSTILLEKYRMAGENDDPASSDAEADSASASPQEAGNAPSDDTERDTSLPPAPAHDAGSDEISSSKTKSEQMPLPSSGTTLKAGSDGDGSLGEAHPNIGDRTMTRHTNEQEHRSTDPELPSHNNVDEVAVRVGQEDQIDDGPTQTNGQRLKLMSYEDHELMNEWLLISFMVHMALADSFCRFRDFKWATIHILRAQHYVHDINPMKLLPSDSCALELVAWEFAYLYAGGFHKYFGKFMPRPKADWKTVQAAAQLYGNKPGSFEFKDGVMRKRILKMCLGWCEAELKKTTHLPGVWRHLPRGFNGSARNSAERMALFMTLWRRWRIQSKLPAQSEAIQWAQQAQSDMGISPTQLLWRVCQMIRGTPNIGDQIVRLVGYKSHAALLWRCQRRASKLNNLGDTSLFMEFISTFGGSIIGGTETRSKREVEAVSHSHVMGLMADVLGLSMPEVPDTESRSVRESIGIIVAAMWPPMWPQLAESNKSAEFLSTCNRSVRQQGEKVAQAAAAAIPSAFIRRPTGSIYSWQTASGYGEAIEHSLRLSARSTRSTRGPASDGAGWYDEMEVDELAMILQP